MNLPSTPEEVIAFIGSRYISMQTHTLEGAPLRPDQVRYDLTVHELLDAFRSLVMAREASASEDIEQAYISLAIDGIRSSSLAEGIEALRVRLKNQEIVVKAAHGVSGRIKAAAIKLGYDPATADQTALDFLIERAQGTQAA